MHRLIVLCLVMLAACAPEPPATGGTGASMSSVAGFDPAVLNGGWHEVAAIGRPPGAAWRVQPRGAGSFAAESDRDGAGLGQMTGPGRFSLTSFDAPLWVLWADADGRTLVLGTPSRDFAMVLDRGRTIPADRMRAAKEILAWNGYDPKALAW